MLLSEVPANGCRKVDKTKLEEISRSDPVTCDEQAKSLAVPGNEGSITSHGSLHLLPLECVKSGVLIGAPVKRECEFDDVPQGNHVQQAFRGCDVYDMERCLHS